VLAEVPEDKRAIVEESLKPSKKLREGVLAREDYSKNSDELRAERQKFDGEVAEARSRINGWESWYGKTSTEVATMKEQLAAYEAEHGPLSGDKGSVKHPAVKSITEEDLQKAIYASQGASLKFGTDLMKVGMRHMKQFGEELDTDKLIEVATKENLPLNAAYDVMVADKREEARTKALNERIKKEREEAVSDFQAKHHFPVVSPDSGRPHALDLQPKVGKTETDRVAAAVGDFSKNWDGRA
jgi:hypothetical protein